MKFIPWLASATFLILPFLATAAGVQIPKGLYQEPGKAELITVSNMELEFEMLPPNHFENKSVHRTYKFKLLDDGTIQVIGSSNDRFFVMYILNFEWSWRGEGIVRKDRKSGATLVFSPVVEKKATTPNSTRSSK